MWNAAIFGKWQWKNVKLIMTSVEQSNPWRIADEFVWVCVCVLYCSQWQKINHLYISFVNWMKRIYVSFEMWTNQCWMMFGIHLIFSPNHRFNRFYIFVNILVKLLKRVHLISSIALKCVCLCVFCRLHLFHDSMIFFSFFPLFVFSYYLPDEA